MFERFTDSARGVVRGAVGKGEDAGAVAPEHLLLALLERPGTGTAVLADLDVDRDAVAEAVRERHRRGGLSRADAEALADLGIDVDAVVAAVEREHGPGAMAPSGGRRRFHTPFTAEAKRVLEQSLREALDLRDKHIGDEHILLALLVLGAEAEVGVSYTDVRARLTASRRGTGRS
jgi:ATP-dependent Clp protease ATP-binding subunit ClpA